MKLKIQNFGPILNAEIDLDRDFILIVGQNNIGKSYAISLIYSIIKSFNKFRRAPIYYYMDELDIKNPQEIKKIISQITNIIQKSTKRDVDITNEINEILKIHVSLKIIPQLQQTLNGTFSDVRNLPNKKSKSQLRIILEDDKFLIEIGVKEDEIFVSQIKIKNSNFVARKVNQNRSIKFEIQKTIIYYPNDNQKHFEESISKILFIETTSIIDSVCGPIFDLHYLPASRSGLYQSLSAFGQIIAELSKSRTGLRHKIELPGISEPLSDYFLKLSDIKVTASETESTAFHLIAKSIEKDILKGTVEFESKTRRLLFQPTGIDLSLDLSSTSSMVSEISPIASYLKYILPRSKSNIERLYVRSRKAAASQLLIIEEPEAHLHPEVQIKFLEILAKLALEENIKIIITSHSNYIFNKCSNLIIGNKINKEKFESILFVDGEQGSSTQELISDQFGIEDENFSDTGENLFSERSILIQEKINAE